MDNLGVLYKELGQYDKAELQYTQSLDKRKKLYGEGDEEMSISYNYLAMLYEETGRYDEALELYAQALEIREIALGTENSDYAVSLNNLAAYYTNRGYYEDALPLFLQAAEVLEMDVSQKSNYSSTLNAMGVVSHRLGDCKQAVEYYKKSLGLKEEMLGLDHIDYADDLSNMAHAYECLGDLDRAELLFEQSNNIYIDQIYNQFPFLNEKDKENFYNQVSYNFESFNSFAIKRIASNPLIIRKVYDLHVLHKGLLLDESKKLRKRILTSDDTASIGLYNFWTTQKELLATLYAAQDQSEELKEVEVQVDALERKLLVQSTGFSDLHNNQRITWRDVQNHLQPGEVAIEVVRSQIYENEWLDSVAYFAMIVTPPPKERPGLIVFLDGNNLEGKYFTNYQNALKFRIPDTVSYNNYWKPFDDVLSTYGEIKKIYFSADGVYNKINVAGLLNAKSGKYVIDEYDIHLMSNTKDLLYIEEKKSQMLTAALFGFPDFENKDISETEMDVSIVLAYQPLPVDNSRYFSRGAVSELPGTKVEIESIHEMLQQSHLEISIHTRGEASEANIKAMDPPDIVHIATHGFFLKDGDITRNGQRGLMVEDNIRENPLLRSGLLLAGANNTLQAMQRNEFLKPGHEDGILTAYEVSNLNLMNTKLVVLSACETGLGEIKNGQGVYGLQRAFSVAGAKTLIMSLWKVSDDATQKLMTYFYGHLVENKPIRESFRLAQLELREEYNHPYFWAAFVIVGN
jgi:CHAT domain-containing protein/tetratricopeptide (TPR) repeat protein